MARRRLLLLLLLIALLALVACDGEEASTGTNASVGTGGAALAEDASPEEVQQAFVSSLRQLGRVRVEATETRDLGGGQVLVSQIEQLIDSQNKLARETVTRETQQDEHPTGAADRQFVSVIGLELVRMYQGGTEAPQVSRYTRIREEQGPPLPPYGLDLDFLERARPAGAERLDDGGWELLLEPQLDAVQAGLAFEQPITLRLLLGPDLLPREVETQSQGQVGTGTASAGPDGSTVTSESVRTETYTTRIEYSFESIEPLTEAEVTLELPEGHKVVDEARQLPLDRPAVEGWPQYWLGPEVLGLDLRDATFREYLAGPEGPKRRAVMQVYAQSESGGVPSLMLISQPREEGEKDTWEERTAPAQEGDSTSQEDVGGRQATVHMRVVTEPLPAFVLSVVFSDAVIDITGNGLNEEQGRQALDALRSL